MRAVYPNSAKYLFIGSKFRDVFYLGDAVALAREL
jgi:hypothetical protein